LNLKEMNLAYKNISKVFINFTAKDYQPILNFGRIVVILEPF